MTFQAQSNICNDDMLLPNNFSAGKSHVNSVPNGTFNEISYNAGPEVFVNNAAYEDSNNNLLKLSLHYSLIINKQK